MMIQAMVKSKLRVTVVMAIRLRVINSVYPSYQKKRRCRWIYRILDH